MAQPESPNGALKALRAKYKKELYGEENQGFLNDILALTIAEVGESSAEAQRAVLETLMNRADAYGRSIKKEYGGGYYQPVNTKTISKQLKKIQDNESLRDTIKERVKEVFEGSNESNFALHNGSAGVAKKARDLADVRKVIKYGSGSETFYNKSKDDGSDHYGSGVIKLELKWINQFGIPPEAPTPNIRPEINSKSRDGKSTSTNEDKDYPVLTEKAEQLKGEVAGGFVSLAANMFPDRVAAAITSSLPSNIASLPSASKISGEILESIRSGEGVKSFTSAVEKISSAGTPVGRLQAIGDIATEYEADIKALYPNLGNINFKSAVEGIVNIAGQESPSQRLVSGIKLIEQNDPDKIVKLGDILGNLEASALKLGENWKDKPLSELFDTERFSKEDIDLYRETEEQTKGLFNIPGIGKGYAIQAVLFSENNQIQKDAIISLMSSIPEEKMPDISGLKESLPTLLSGSLEDIAKTPLVTEQLGNLPERILTARRPEAIETALTRFAGDIISKETDGAIDRNTSQTLLAGGTEEEAKKMRQTIGGMALDNFIESNPTLAGIVQWFSENKELITLLGSAGAMAGLSSLLGGGALGGFAAGAGGIAGARLLLGEEGFNEFTGMMKQAAAPVFDMASGFLEESGLADIEGIGSFLKGTLDLGRENPLAGLAAISGNLSSAAGILAATNIDTLMGKTSTIIETLSTEVGQDTQVSSDSAAVGNGDASAQQTTPTAPSGQQAQNPGNPAIESQASMYHMLAHPNYQDFGRTGMGSVAGI